MTNLFTNYWDPYARFIVALCVVTTLPSDSTVVIRGAVSVVGRNIAPPEGGGGLPGPPDPPGPLGSVPSRPPVRRLGVHGVRGGRYLHVGQVGAVCV